MKNRSVFLLTFFYFSILNCAIGSQEGGGILRVNWLTPMYNIPLNDDICINVNPSNELHIEMYACFDIEDITLYPQMYFYYNLPSSNEEFYIPITQDMVEVVIGEVYSYKASHTLIFDLSDNCEISDYFCFELNTQLVMYEGGEYYGYPCGLFNDEGELFPSNIFSEAISPTSCCAHENIKKQICCNGIIQLQEPCNNVTRTSSPFWCYNFIDPVDGKLINDAMYAEKKQSINNIKGVLSNNYFFPNPFTDRLIIRDIGQMSIHIFDLFGREVVSLDFEEELYGSGNIDIDVSTLKKGTYFLVSRFRKESEQAILVKTD